MADFEMIAKTFQGLESVLAQELTELGADNIQMGHRMVSFTGNQEMLYRANFNLRTAIRILKPIKHFRATTADEVYDAVKAIDWSEYLSLDTSFAVDSVVYSSEFRHSKFVAYKVKDAIVDQFRERQGERPNIHITNPDIQLHIHVAEYDCTLSLDSSGESLHRRGYRQESVEAPLNEVLAAGIVLMTGWRGECDFIDPMCGSGTIPIEAALIARGIAPGVYRKEYAFEKWPDFDRALFDSIYEDDSWERPFAHHIYGYDINRAAVAIATRNVKAAGLSKEITIDQRDIADLTQPEQRTILVTNPPYGERISSPDLLGLYKTIGERLKHQFVGNDAWVLSYREECFDKIGLKPSLRMPLFNGSLECELRKYQMFSGRFNDMRAEGHDIKTPQERRLMADHKRFKQHREFRERLDDDPEERMRDRRGERRNAFSRRGDEDGDRRQRFAERSERPARRPSSRNPFAPHAEEGERDTRNDRRGERREGRNEGFREKRSFKGRDYGNKNQGRGGGYKGFGRSNKGRSYGNEED